MKPGKLKQILAWAGIILLVCLYLITLLTAIFDHSPDRYLFKFCLFTSLVSPILIYVFIMLSRLKK